MKKLSLLCAMVLVSIASMSAADLRIYASAVKLVSFSENVATIDYVLNENATALELQLLDEEDHLVATKAITDAAALTLGAHAGVAVELADVAAGTYKWALKATASAIAAVTRVNDPSNPSYVYYGPRGVAVDNNPASAHFGNIYVVNMAGGVSTENPGSVNSTRGIYMLNAARDMKNTNHEAYTGNVAWAGTANSGANNSPYRPAIDEDGNVFICSSHNDLSNVYVMDPANPTADYTPVFNPADKGTVYTKINSMVVTGKGANRQMYGIDWTDAIVRYDLGAALPFAGNPDTVVSKEEFATKAHIANSQNSIARDPMGGFWVCQYRAALDTYPMLAHFGSADTCDWKMSSESNASLAPANTGRGAMGLSVDGSMVAIGGNRNVYVYNVAYDSNGVPTVTASGLTLASVEGSNVDGICFDIVGNLYAVTASKERLYIYGLPTENNSFVTPAAGMITIEEAPAPEITWSDFLGNGSSPFVSDYTNCFKYSTPLPQGVGVVNIQTPGFATATGIYMTFPAGISECSLGAGNYDVQGAGIILHCDAFVQQITEVTVVDGLGSYTFYIWNENGSNTPTDLENVEATEAKKFFRNGQIFIQKGNAVYTMTGVRVE